MRQCNIVTFLGACSDSKLKWDIYVENVCRSMSNSTYSIRNLKGCVSDKTISPSYFALFHSVMSCCVVKWGNSCYAYRVLGLQRRVLRIISNLGYILQTGLCKPRVFPFVYILELIVVYKERWYFYTRRSIIIKKQSNLVHNFSVNLPLLWKILQ